MEAALNWEEMLKDPKFRELVSQYKKPHATESKLPTTESKPPDPSGVTDISLLVNPLLVVSTHTPPIQTTMAIHLAACTPLPMIATMINTSTSSCVHAPLATTKMIMITTITVARACNPLVKANTTATTIRIADWVPPRHAEIKPLQLSEQLPDPPDGWNDKGYYLSAPVSYEIGGKNGDRAGGKQGGPSMIFDKNGTKVKYKTFLEKMSKEDKYLFVKEHNHPFTDIMGIPYFNPYGKVLLDDKLTTIIHKPVVTQAAVVCNILNNATIAPGKFLTWAHFGLSVHLQVYHYVYQIKPYYYHFHDKMGENNWLIDSEAWEYLKEVGRYLKKTRNQTVDPVDYLHQHESKNMKNKGIQKSYIEEPDTNNPYYFPKFGADKKYAGSMHALEALTKHTAPASSSTKAYDARRADRIVAQEKAHAKDGARATKPGKSAPAKGVPKTGGAKVKTETKAKHRMVSDEESDDNGSKIPKPKQKEPESEEELDEPEQLLAMEFVKKPNKAKSKLVEPEEKEEEPMGEAPMQAKLTKQKKSKQKIASSEVDKLKEYEPPMKETAKPDKVSSLVYAMANKYLLQIEAPLPLKLKFKEKESEDDLEKGILSIKECTWRKMLLHCEPEPKENEPQQSEDNEVGKEAVAKSRSKSKQLALSPEAGEPEESEKLNNQAVSSKQGRKHPLQPRAKEDKEEEEEEEEGQDEELGTKRNPTPLSSVLDNSSSINYQPSVDGMRVMKATTRLIKVPTPGSVAS
ncbi:unnamed protein product, partial [Rhizoctonia solani]